MSELNELVNALPWQYPIGAVVCHRGALEPWVSPSGYSADRGPARLTILARAMRQCSAGVALLYRVRAVPSTTGLPMPPEWVLEEELRPYPEQQRPPKPERPSVEDVRAMMKNRPGS